LQSPIERFLFWRIENHATVLVGLEVGMLGKDAVSKDFRKQVLGYGLTTAEIVYRRPDRHWLLQKLHLAGLRYVSEFSGAEGISSVLGKVA
jgi:Usg-like family